MPIDTKHDDLKSLRIDRSERTEGGEPSPWARRIITIGIVVVALLSLSVLAYRLFYKRGCQEHSSSSAGSAVMVRGIQSLVR
jgi:hypothetical protein